MKSYNQFVSEMYSILEYADPNSQTELARRIAAQRARNSASALNAGGKFATVRRIGGAAIAPLSAAIDVGSETMAQKERGRRTSSALAMGATKAASGWAGAVGGAKVGATLGAGIGGLFGGVGAAPGAAIGGVLGGIGGYAAGSKLGGKTSEMVAGATGKEKAAMAQANRQRQAGGGLAGIGGKTSFSQKKPGGPAFMSTGSGAQRKTVQLAKTSVIKDPTTGKSETGYLAFKGGKPVYKRGQDPSTLARTSSNWSERVGRTIIPGAYAGHDEKVRQAKLKTAAQNDIARQRKLGVVGSKNLVGPKIVGPKPPSPK
jgi:hypothetical protein